MLLRKGARAERRPRTRGNIFEQSVRALASNALTICLFCIREDETDKALLEFCGCEDLLGKNMPDRKTVERLSNLMDRLQGRTNAKTIFIDDAFQIATELESSEVNGIYARLIGPVRGTP
jgi:hypothetical protein